MATENLDQKLVLQAQKISEIYSGNLIPNESKQQIITIMKDQFDEFFNEMVDTLKE